MVLHVALILRFLQGTAVAMSYTTIYAIITNKYPNKKEALLGMLEASFGLGLICGPLAGASLYRMFGFEKTFYIYGSFFLICTFFLCSNLKNYITCDYLRLLDKIPGSLVRLLLDGE